VKYGSQGYINQPGAYSSLFVEIFHRDYCMSGFTLFIDIAGVPGSRG
jgi:hypothetical protein